MCLRRKSSATSFSKAQHPFFFSLENLSNQKSIPPSKKFLKRYPRPIIEYKIIILYRVLHFESGVSLLIPSLDTFPFKRIFWGLTHRMHRDFSDTPASKRRKSFEGGSTVNPPKCLYFADLYFITSSSGVSLVIWTDCLTVTAALLQS